MTKLKTWNHGCIASKMVGKEVRAVLQGTKVPDTALGTEMLPIRW